MPGIYQRERLGVMCAKLGSVCTFQTGVSRKHTPDPRLGIFRLAGTIHCLPAADGAQAGNNHIDQMWLR